MMKHLSAAFTMLTIVALMSLARPQQAAAQSPPSTEPAGQTVSSSLAGSQAASSPAGEPTISMVTAPESSTQPTQVSLKALGKEFQPLVEKLPQGEIDWTHGELIAIGVGKAQGTSAQQSDMAQRAARLAAARNAALLAGGVRVGPGGRFADIRQGQIKADVIVENFHELSNEFDPATRTATVKMTMPLHGPKGVVRLISLEADRPAKTFAWPAPAKDQAQVGVLLIDARGSGFKPCLLPRVASSSGQALYGPWQLNQADLTSRSSVTYCHIQGEAVPHEPAGANAGSKWITVTAAKVESKSHGTLTLSDSDVQALARHDGAASLMAEGRIVVIVDPPAAEH